ncbi:hypothetical protein EYZ11_009253 [Aspergillus tanneri]|uniref:Uncharacterized protein n=1 Tax=Aspergillus tanneri TaxID=1220188 RepID=A0A4S3J8B8_9EURO|nr:hypothetical protein EYZ11_009253 [Aspergillus tanneri]
MTDCSLSPVVPYALINCHGDVQGDAEVVLKAKQTLFKVRLARQPPEEFDQSETVEGKFLKRLANRRTAEIAREDLADFLGPLCQPFFKSYARYFGDSLKSHLKNPEVFLQLVTDKGVPKVFKTPPFHVISYPMLQL